MCLFPRLIKNPKYRANKKNGGNIPEPIDKRVMTVPIGCGYCMECMKKKANNWKVRLLEDIKTNTNGKFITLTFSNESYTELANEINKKRKDKIKGYTLDNEIATIATRRFLERWRKHNKKSVRHWLISELGQKNTEHLHLHGIIWCDKIEEIEKRWTYGYVWKGKKHRNTGEIINYVNEKTIGYITKYVTKVDFIHKYYKPVILCSPGIGNNYINTHNFIKNLYNGKETKETYTFRNGFKSSLPIYFRNKAYTEEEREHLWLKKLDEGIRWVGGEKVKEENEEGYNALVKWYREKNRELGYAEPENWDTIKYEQERRILKQQERFRRKSGLPAAQ